MWRTKEDEGIKQNTHTHHIDTNNNVMIARRRGKREWKVGESGQSERWAWKNTWGDGYTVQCVDDVSLNCTRETCMAL